MQLESDGIRRAIAIPMGSGDPQAKSDRPASAMRVIATRGIRSCRDRRCGDRFDDRLAAEPAAARRQRDRRESARPRRRRTIPFSWKQSRRRAESRRMQTSLSERRAHLGVRHKSRRPAWLVCSLGRRCFTRRSRGSMRGVAGSTRRGRQGASPGPRPTSESVRYEFVCRSPLSGRDLWRWRVGELVDRSDGP